MKQTFLLTALALTCAPALAAKPCEELKQEIATKIQANGVSAYTLDIVSNDEATDEKLGGRKVVGSCEGGSKKIVYLRK